MNLQELSRKYWIGLETLKDIVKELRTIPHDPREDLQAPVFSSNAIDIKDIEVGTKLQWVIRNITDFGAFVDIWLHNDGLVHKSQMADFYVSHPIDVVSLGQEVQVRVIDIDMEREKISLSMKSEGNASAQRSDYTVSTKSISTIEKDNYDSGDDEYSWTQNTFAQNMIFIKKK